MIYNKLVILPADAGNGSDPLRDLACVKPIVRGFAEQGKFFRRKVRKFFTCEAEPGVNGAAFPQFEAGVNERYRRNEVGDGPGVLCIHPSAGARCGSRGIVALGGREKWKWIFSAGEPSEQVLELLGLVLIAPLVADDGIVS